MKKVGFVGYIMILAMLATISICLSGCETVKKVYTVVTDPDIPVGAPAEQPTELTLTLFADEDINPNQSGEPSPVQLEVVFLKEDSLFLGLDYDQFLNDGPEKTLGKNYISHQDFTLVPGQFKPLSPIKLDAETQYIGVVAHLAWIDEVQWSDLVEIKSTGEKVPLMIHVSADGVAIKKKEYQEKL
ncbi:type VI secretion system lipoprotein TssJ [Metakosakonia massiliensis]|uniref:Type VI secretion lipoprotein n=1 Tax=Phytobacter massiliensis TaxID=1485952 RepID=A0A6N3AG42_9ENTR|nr:type VI secretion system lipoprotein TssJ [Phytobacter massiliensis]